MRTYREAVMKVDGKSTAKLEIFGEHNIFHVYEDDENVFVGTYSGTKKFIEDWKIKYTEIRKYLEEAGHFVTFEQTF